ncbi:MAG: FAD-binding oxidoreductase [Gemmatimonadota bacterium]|nr:FAD-binding oxidoreductase [Gemmatimonadota bacterium]
MRTADLQKDLKTIISNYTPADEATLADQAIDGVVPDAVVAPDTVETLAAVIGFASEKGLKVAPRGGGTKMDLGMPPERVDLIVSLEHLNQIIEYAPADMTATVQAGIRLADLQADLAQGGQRFPLDPPHSDACTIGGVLSTNSSGALRWIYGTARDLVIGTKVVQADGTVVKAGGKVVKNVAGYDLNKMYIGALGTLGILVEVTLKVQPKPETGQAIIGRFPFISTVTEAAQRVLDSDITPGFIEMANPVPVAILARRAGRGLGDTGFPLIIGAFGPEESVEWQMADARKICESMGAVQVFSVKDTLYDLTLEVIQEIPTGQAVPRGMLPGIVCRASVPPEDLGRLYQMAEDRCQKKAIGCAMISHFGNGAMTLVFYLEKPFENKTVDILTPILTELTAAASNMDGSFTIDHAPVALKERISVWGTPRNDWVMMKQIKDRFDPRRTLNPGRFINGI